MTVAIRPQPGLSRQYHFPAFERHQLDNGMQVIIAPVKKLPIVSVAVIVKAGAVADPPNKAGIAQLTAQALTEGTARYDGEALTDQLEQLGTSIDASTDWDSTLLSLTVLTDKLHKAFEHLADVLVTPTFPNAAIERIKGERIAEILQVLSEPRTLADEQFDAFIYASGSRFTLPVGGTRASVKSITQQDVLDFYAMRYHPSATTIIVVGDITVDDTMQMVHKTLACWTGSLPQLTTVDDHPARTTQAVHIVHKGDAPQSELRFGHVSVPRTHPDYFRLTVTNALLGGLFSSRINLNLREAHGYTYGARSEFDWRNAAGPFVISTAVASNVTALAVQETLSEINRMRTGGVAEDELSLATSYLDGVFPIRFETTAAIASALATLVIYGMPDDWYDNYRANIRAVSAADVLAMMQTHIHPEQLQIVVVGDAAAIREPLEALHVGPITVHDAERVSENGSHDIEHGNGTSL